MGVSLGKIFRKVLGKKEIRLLLVGLDAAGKTTILYRLRLGVDVDQELSGTVPTIGFNVESVKFKNLTFNVWDLGGQERIRPLWRRYYTGTQGLIFVVDSNDTERLPEAKGELMKILNDNEMAGCALLVFANKMDLPNSMSPEDIIKGLDLHTLRDKEWHVQASNARTGAGLEEGLTWLSKHIRAI